MKVEKIDYKGEKVHVIVLNRRPSHAQEWAGLVTGLHEKYGLALDFCKVLDRRWSRSGKNGSTIVMLKGAGFYKVSNPATGLYGRNAIKYYYWDGKSKVMQLISESEIFKKLR